jgi:two-component system chemotaxis response regulator CheY
MRVLIADDDLLYLKVLEKYLQDWGFEVVTAGSGQEAWEIIQEDQPHIAILDWVMPGFDGVDICREIRARKMARYVYVIILTVKSRPEDIVEGLGAGADDYIVKPFDMEEMKIRTNIGKRIIELEQGILRLAKTDYLTSLMNRRAFMERLQGELNRALRADKPMGLVISDIDNFKIINDSYGHIVGDKVLQEFGKLLSTSFRLYDFVGRYGGEEFIIALPGANAEETARIAERVRQSVANQNILVSDLGRAIKITASFGISSFVPGISATVDELIKKADEALYKAKREGRNRVVVFSE